MVVSNIPRLQQLLYAKANLRYCIGRGPTIGYAAYEYMRAAELVVSSSAATTYTLRDLIVAVCVAGLLSEGATVGQPAAAQGALQIMSAMGLDTNNRATTDLAASGNWSNIHSGGLLALVKAAGTPLVQALLRLGNGQLPMVLLLPHQAMQLSRHLFVNTEGVLPSHYSKRNEEGFTKALQQSNQTTATILLTLTKLFQDATAQPATAVTQFGPLTVGGLAPSTSLVLPLYYMSLCLHPTAATCNNLGILMAGLPIVTTIWNRGRPTQVNGQALAMHYYTAGLELDPRHAHLYTNLGSLLKDLGNLEDAITNYEKAIALQPSFEVALANLGNSLRDAGRTEDALPFYRRALHASKANPMPEAMCGLLNGLLSMADWNEAFSEEPVGLLHRVASLVERQLEEGREYGTGALQSSGSLEAWLQRVLFCLDDKGSDNQLAWLTKLGPFFSYGSVKLDRKGEKINEGSFVIRLIELLHRKMQWRWYQQQFESVARLDGSATVDLTTTNSRALLPTPQDSVQYSRITLPSALVSPAVPTVLPFHTFSYGIEGIMSARNIRLISHRNAIRISHTALTQPWLPAHVYPPPAPPSPKIRVGYVSSDFNNHPLAHLMQSVFGFHDLDRFEVYLYATSASDQSPYRKKIEAEARNFLDVSAWSNAQTIDRILHDGIHILMNLNGYTKGAKNEVFAARPCPVQMQFMGFAGGMASGWIDYVVVDETVCPPAVTSIEAPLNRAPRIANLPGSRDPEDLSDDWMYTEKFIYMPHSYFVNDHKQGFREPETRQSAINGELIHPHDLTPEEAWQEEEERRWKARKELFPGLPDDYVIFATFNQLYKVEPTLFKTWLQILAAVPSSVLWLLRFPPAGEANILKTAREWAGDSVAARIIFTDVAPKDEHIRRGRVADLFLDTFEVNAHTTACDCLWSGTPILTWPKWELKQASLVAASIAKATGLGEEMIVKSAEEYVQRAVEFAQSVRYVYQDGQGNALTQQGPSTGGGGSASVRGSDLARLGASAARAAKKASATSASTATSTAASGQLEGAPAPANVQRQALDSVEEEQADSQSRRRSSIVSSTSTIRPTTTNSTSSSKSTSAAAGAFRSSVLLPIDASLQAPVDSTTRRGSGRLIDLRRQLFLTRDTMPLFDTEGWVRDLERGYEEAWKRWVEGKEWNEDASAEGKGHICVNRLA